MDNIEIPEYFICPISLQIMKDPVTTLSGITYDRESIQRWLFNNNGTTIRCPVTMQPLPRDTDLTPNHTLRRLIQTWCYLNPTNGVDPIPNPEPPLNKFHVFSLIKGLRHQPDSQMKIRALQKLEALAAESERNRVLLCDADLATELISFITSCYQRRSAEGLEEALGLSYLVRASFQSRGISTENEETVESLIWVLGGEFFRSNLVVKQQAACLLKVVIQRTNPGMLERLKPEFFETVFSNLRPENLISKQGMIFLLNIVLATCPWGRNRVIMVEYGAVFDLIEVELRNQENKQTELVLEILCHLCSCADGRAQLVNHAAGISVVTRRILKVSPVADDSAVFIIWLISKYSGTNAILNEMLRVGTVAKLCMVMQANCAAHLKEKVKEILKTHSDVWNPWTTVREVGFRKMC